MVALSLWSPFDSLLGVVAPLALAASVSTAIVVDLEPDEPPLPSAATLADLVSRGPTRSELRPERKGVAVLANGGIGWDASAAVVAALVDGWPHVVMRTRHATPLAPLIPVLPLLPASVIGRHDRAIYQRGAWRGEVGSGSMSLPRPSASSIQALLDGRRPINGPWLRAWRRVWKRSWE